MPPAARVGDLHSCPAHAGGGPLSDGSPTVKIGGLAAARVGDRGTCNGAVDTIVQGSPTVLIEGRPAARAGDKCAHSGVIAMGCPTVIIGNVGSSSSSSPGAASGEPQPGGGGGGAATDAPAGSEGAVVHGTPVSNQVVGSLATMAMVYASGGGAGSALGSAIRSVASQLEVALARNDLGAISGMTGRLEGLLQKAAPDGSGAADSPKAEAETGRATPLESPAGQTIPSGFPTSVVVREGRVAVNDKFVGIHAISEFDLVSLQAAGRLDEIVRRLMAASAAGRNCARIFCMFQNPRGELVPRSIPGYWKAVDAIVRRLAVYSMFGEFVLLADCERRPDGSGGTMPSWDDRRTFVREAGQFFKGKPVIVNGMNEPAGNGAASADDPRLLELMRVFREASGGTVPFSIGDPAPMGDGDVSAGAAVQETLAASGASILVLHGGRRQPDDRRYRWWVDRLKGFGDLRRRPLAGSPYLYHSEPMGFGSRREEGRRDNDPEAAVAAACVCAIGQMGFCYHRIASDDPATPGLDLARVATLVPQSPDFAVFEVGAEGAPIARFNKDDFPGGTIHACSNGSEAWAVGYGKRVAKSPRVEWRGLTPEEIWRGERVILWRARASAAG